MKVNIIFVIISRWFFFLEWEMFQKKSYKENKTTILYLITFFKSFRLWDNVEKYSRGGETKIQAVWNSLAIDDESYKLSRNVGRKLPSILCKILKERWPHLRRCESLKSRISLVHMCFNLVLS